MKAPVVFEWDDDKAASNLADHAVSFPFAARVFQDENGLDDIDDRFDYGEERRNSIGVVDGRVYVVTYNMRAASCRIISARPASRKERRRYDNKVPY